MQRILTGSDNSGHLIFASLLFATFQIWDAVITSTFVNHGIAYEANILIANLVQSGDFLLIKLLSIPLIVLPIWILYKYHPRIALIVPCCLAIFYLAVITWNFLVIFSSIA